MRYASGKYAKFISDQSGMAFPYKERIKQWNGLVVHTSEYEAKHPQLEPSPPPFEPEALYEPRPARKEPMVVAVGESVFGLEEAAPYHAQTQLGVVTVETS
jgi:hypothetical protein|tara:strand:- start:3536 stop:3838 length:303 start_codon:yes stop_codon:yes gene_type:complete